MGYLNSAGLLYFWKKVKAELDKKRNKTENPLESVSFRVSEDGDLIVSYTENENKE